MTGNAKQFQFAKIAGRSPRRLRWSQCAKPAIISVTLIGSIFLCGCRTEGGRRRGIRQLQLQRVNGYLEFVVRDRTQEQRSKVGSGRTRTDETVFEENLKLETAGFAYHPNFLDFTLAALFGLRQHDFASVFGKRQRQSQGDETVVEFEFNGQLLKHKPYPATVYARRYRALQARAFLPSLEVTTRSIGFTWRYVDDKFPISLQFNDTDVRLAPQSDLEEGGRQQNTTLRLEATYLIDTGNVLSFKYEFESRKEEPLALDYDSNELTLSHELTFGEDKRHRLESELNYFDQKGTFSVERFRWREILRLQHTERLKSWYIFEYVDRTQGSFTALPPIKERSYSISAAIEHKLYESLISQFYLYAHFQDFASGLESERFGGQLSFDYRKKNRWGVLLGRYRLLLQTEDRQGVGQQVEIQEESYDMIDPEPITLANPNVTISSIVVRDENRTTVFHLERDYTLMIVGDRVELSRIPTGSIADGSTVLIDYVFTLGTDYKLDTLTHDFELRQQFKFGLTPYYRYRRQEQTIKPKNATGALPEDVLAHTIGMEFRRGRLRWRAEYEDHDSSIDPFDAVRLSAGYSRRLKSGATVTLGTRWSKFDHKPPNTRQTRFFGVEARYRHPITAHLTVETTAEYRNESDSISGDDEGIDLDLTLEWSVRKTEFRLMYEYGKYNNDFSESDFSTLYVLVRRRF